MPREFGPDMSKIENDKDNELTEKDLQEIKEGIEEVDKKLAKAAKEGENFEYLSDLSKLVDNIKALVEGKNLKEIDSSAVKAVYDRMEKKFMEQLGSELNKD